MGTDPRPPCVGCTRPDEGCVAKGSEDGLVPGVPLSGPVSGAHQRVRRRSRSARGAVRRTALHGPGVAGGALWLSGGRGLGAQAWSRAGQAAG